MFTDCHNHYFFSVFLPYPSTPKAKLAFEHLDVPKLYHPFIMGANNSMVKSICESTGARVNIPPLSLNKNDITVAGEKDCVTKAVGHILKLLEEVVHKCLGGDLMFAC